MWTSDEESKKANYRNVSSSGIYLLLFFSPLDEQRRQQCEKNRRGVFDLLRVNEERVERKKKNGRVLMTRHRQKHGGIDRIIIALDARMTAAVVVTYHCVIFIVLVPGRPFWRWLEKKNVVRHNVTPYNIVRLCRSFVGL